MTMYVDDEMMLACALDKLVFSTRPAPRPHAVSAPLTWSVPGLLGKTRIRTTQGELPIGSLRAGDAIQSTSGRTLRIRRMDRINLDYDFLQRHPEAQPVHIMANAFGRGLPERDLVISAGQELALATGDVPLRRMKAGDIKGNASVSRALHGALTYHVIELDQPAYLFAEGVPVLIPGKARAARDEVEAEDCGVLEPSHQH